MKTFISLILLFPFILSQTQPQCTNALVFPAGNQLSFTYVANSNFSIQFNTPTVAGSFYNCTGNQTNLIYFGKTNVQNVTQTSVSAYDCFNYQIINTHLNS